MKILILTLGTGEGHNSAAKALREAAVSMGHQADLLNPIELSSQWESHLVDNVYNQMIKYIPSMFGAVYKVGTAYGNTNLPSPIYQANARYAEKLAAKLANELYDAVIAVHIFAMETLSAIRLKNYLSIPSFGVDTDYTCVPFLKEVVLDRLYIPHEDLIPLFIGKNLTRKVLRASGIPISSAYEQQISRQDARGSLGLDQDQKIILIMTGGIGCGDTGDLCDEVLKEAQASYQQQPWQVLVLTGRNEKSRAELEERFAGAPQVSFIPFTTQVPLYLRACDVLITKPGGLTSTEAAAAGIPLVHLLSVPGVENYNVTFFAAKGMSVYAENMQEAAKQAVDLTLDEPRASLMIRSQKQNINPHAASDIIREVTSWKT